MNPPRPRPRAAAFLSVHYRILCEIVAAIADDDARHKAADHFATEFRKRYPDGFDPAMWEKLTGGKVQGFDIRTGKFESVAIERIVKEVEAEAKSPAGPRGGYNRTYHRHNRGPA